MPIRRDSTNVGDSLEKLIHLRLKAAPALIGPKLKQLERQQQELDVSYLTLRFVLNFKGVGSELNFMSRAFFSFFLAGVFAVQAQALPAPAMVDVPRAELDLLRTKLMNKAKTAQSHKATLIFDLPVTYNRRVAHWLQYFQVKGNVWFRDWLERSSKYMPFIQKELRRAGLPADLGYMVMIESGFDPFARSPANAVGPWQFMKPTAERYGLKVNWWIDERRDFKKSTLTAIKYMKDLYQEFGSWYLVAASYNMGETGLRRRISKYGTKDFWSLSAAGALPQETIDYVPKILAAMLIAKAPSLYGFLNVSRMDAFEYDVAYLGGGTDINQLADFLGVTRKSLRDMNAELVLGYVPLQVDRHPVRIPNGAQQKVLEFVQGPRSAKN